jgi:SulP family sulfate permease
LLFYVEGELLFGSAPSLERHVAGMRAKVNGDTRVIVLRVKRVRNPDAVCLKVLDSFIKSVKAQGVTVLLCGVRRDLAQALMATGLEQHVGLDCIFPEAASTMSSTLDALRYAYSLLDGDTCPSCPRRAPTGHPARESDYTI